MNLFQYFWHHKLRTATLFLVNTLAFGLAGSLLPGVVVYSIYGAALTFLSISLINILIRPLILKIITHLPLALFVILGLFLDAAIIYITSILFNSFFVESLWDAFILSLVVSIVNTFATSLLHVDETDSYYQNVIVKMAKKGKAVDPTQKRLLVVQVDGLSAPLLQGEIENKKMPTLQKWLSTKTHNFVEWETDLPSMTSSSQAGIMYGNHDNIPAFRWYDKKLKRLFVSNHPKDAFEIDKLLQGKNEGLLKFGSSINNLFSGQAEHNVMTMSQVVDTEGEKKIKKEDFNDYLGNPYNLSRSIILMVWEILVEYKEAFVARNTKNVPKLYRGGVYPLLRASVCVLLRDVTTFLAVAEIYRGRPIIYLDYLGYDEVAHHSGVKSKDAKRVLWKLDRTFAVLEKAIQSANLNYEIILLSDHGQSWGATFKQRYDSSLHEFISQLTKTSAASTESHDEGKTQVNALFSETSKQNGMVGKASKKLKTKEKPAVDVSGDNIVVCASGNLAQVYFQGEDRLDYDQIQKLYPELIQKLISHPGIGFVMVTTNKGPIVFGNGGTLHLQGNKIIGTNPLENFPKSTALSLLKMSKYSNLGDIMVNSFYDSKTGEVCAFEELIGCHGGAGGWQTRPFLIYPAKWSEEPPKLFGADQIYHFIKKYK